MLDHTLEICNFIDGLRWYSFIDKKSEDKNDVFNIFPKFSPCLETMFIFRALYTVFRSNMFVLMVSISQQSSLQHVLL